MHIRKSAKKILKTLLKGYYVKKAFLRILTRLGESGNSSRLNVLEIDVVPDYTYKIINIYPHDKTAFTQGLVFENGVLYEGTGLLGGSSVRKIELETGKVVQTRMLPAQFFGEGIAIYQNRIIQLTWRSKRGFVYDKDSFELLAEFGYSTEGWGITTDGNYLIMSDGTATLYFLDPESFKNVKQIEVYDKRNGPVIRLNDLEYVKGEIYANVWKTDYIARISPKTGQVVGWIELKRLAADNAGDNRVDVLNGIAYDRENDRLFVTGKFWPRLFEIELVSLSSSDT